MSKLSDCSKSFVKDFRQGLSSNSNDKHCSSQNKVLHFTIHSCVTQILSTNIKGTLFTILFDTSHEVLHNSA